MSDPNLAPYDQAKQGEAFLLLPDRAVWKLSGSDRLRYLNGQVTQDIKTLLPGQARYAAVVSAKGRLQGDVWVSATDDALLVDAAGELRESLGARLERYIVADDVLLEDITGDWKILHRLGESPYPFTEGSLAFPNRRFGLPGTDHWVPVNSSLPDPTLDDFGLLEILRIEKGLPRWGIDMNENSLPPEVRLDLLATSYNKGCYIGQEVIARLKSIGHVNKQLAWFKAVEGTTPLPALPAALTDQGKEVGQLTSACFSPLHQRPVALGMIARNSAQEGNVLESAGHSWKLEPFPT